MSKKKIQENPLPEAQEQVKQKQEMTPKTTEKVPETSVVVPTVAPEQPTSGGIRGLLSISKTQPNDMYRRLLPAVLFLMTFVSVMTILLIYMDTVALGAHQFRLNMSRDYELRRIAQDEPSLVAFVRQLHLTPRSAPAPVHLHPQHTAATQLLDQVFGKDYKGTFVEMQPSGPRDPTTQFLEVNRGWTGVVARAAPRDYLALRGHARTLHACLSPTKHPREVTYHSESESSAMSGFRSRVLCLPLYTTLLAASLTTADYLLLSGENAPPALHTLPYDSVHIAVIEVRLPHDGTRNKTTQFLKSQNYSVKAEFDDGVMYVLDKF